jgi:hypothetical protein
MQLTLTTEESQQLIRHLARRLDELDSELVHTDKREMQRALAAEVRALSALTNKIRSSAEEDAEQQPSGQPSPSA